MQSIQDIMSVIFRQILIIDYSDLQWICQRF